MYNEPPYDEEHLRLKRDDREESFSIGWMFMPALLGMAAAVFFMVILPSLLESIGNQARFSRMGDDIAKALNKEFSLLAEFKWAETNLWIYLLAGAVIGIFIRYSFRDENV